MLKRKQGIQEARQRQAAEVRAREALKQQQNINNNPELHG